MLIATFGPTTAWRGKTITFDNGQFTLEGHGAITAGGVMEYDKQGHLQWANDGTRAWVGAKAQSPSTPAVAGGGTPMRPTMASWPAGRAADDARTDGQKVAAFAGLFLLVCGFICAVYFFAFFDTSVAVPTVNVGGTAFGGGRVNNLGLMQDRQNGIIFGFGVAIAGGVLMYIGRKRSPAPAVSQPAPNTGGLQASCDSCRGSVQVGAAYCPHCGKQLSWVARGGEGSG